MNELNVQTTLPWGQDLCGFSHSFHWQMGKTGKDVDWPAPTLAVLPRGRCAGATGTDTETSKGAAAALSEDFLAPGGLCPSPSGLGTCLSGLQNSVPNT